MANSIAECNIMVKASNYYKRIVQVGQQQRSGFVFQESMRMIKDGTIGNLRKVNAWGNFNYGTGSNPVADSAVPEGVDYDMWLGPAPNRPFNRNRFHFTFRWFWDYAGGLMTDWGVHLLDYALYGMNVTTPKSVMAMGGKYGYPADACETPDSLQTIYEFDGFNVLWDHAIGINDGAYGRNHGLGFVGENGTLVVDRDGWEVIPEKVNGKERMQAVPLAQGDGKGLNNHVRNFLTCIQSRNPNTNASVEIGAHIAKFSAIGNIAYRTGKKLVWDGTKFTNDVDANSYLVPTYRGPWELPKV